MTEFLESLLAEQTRLRGEIEARLLERRLEAVTAIIALYQPGNEEARPIPSWASPPKAPAQNRQKSVATAIGDAAEEYLRKVRRRAQTRELVAEVRRLGIRDGGDDEMIATVSSYLSADKDRFDNVRGEGYGLKEWTKPPQSDWPPPSAAQSTAPNGLTAADVL